jgi:hypothetical protein
LSSRAPCCQVIHEASVDDVGESPFEAAQRFEVGLALVALAPVVVLAGAGHPGLGDGRDVQHVVEPAVAASVEPVPVVLPGGHVDGRGAGVAGEVRLGREPTHVDHLSEDLASTQRADAVDADQRAALLGDRVGDLPLEVLQSRVEPLEVSDVVQGEPLAGLADRSAWPHRGQQPAGGGGPQVLPCPAWDELGEHLVQPVDGRDPVADQLLATVGQHLQNLGDVIRADWPQVMGAQAGHGHRERIGTVGLATTATAERADPGRQLRRDVEHRLVLGDQPLGQPGPDTAGAFHRPGPLRERPRERLHRPVAGPVVDEPLLGHHLLVGIDHHQCVARLVRVDPDDNLRHEPSSVAVDGEEGRATSGEAHPS